MTVRGSLDKTPARRQPFEPSAAINETDTQRAIESVRSGLAADIAAEEAARIAADGDLASDIADEEAARIAADSAEEAARIAADDALDTAKADKSTQIISGAGLTGGGDLSTDRTLAVGAGTGIAVDADVVRIADTAVTPGSYTNASITVDQQGRLTAASNGAVSATITTPQGRLTLATGVPIMTTTQAAKTTIYYTPHVGRLVPLYDGAAFAMHDVGAELSQATTDDTKSPAAVANSSNYDLFVWNDSGTYRCTRGPAWSSATARGTGAGTTELERIIGLWVNKVDITNGPAAQRGTYVGSVRSNGSAQIDFTYPTSTPTAALFGVWNAYNRVSHPFTIVNGVASWTYAVAATWRAMNGDNNLRVSMLHGLAEGEVHLLLDVAHRNSALSNISHIGIGVDSTTVSSSVGSLGQMSVAATGVIPLITAYSDWALLGWHFYQALDWVSGGTTTYFSDGSTADQFHGMRGRFVG